MATTLRTVPPEPPLPPTVLPCSDPATGERFGEAAVMDRAAVVATVQRARAAQAAWAATSWAERRAVLSDILKYVVQHQEEICRLAVRDSGKTMVDAAMGEIFPVCEKLRYTIAHGEADLRAERRTSGFLPHKAARVEYLPLGVIGVIAPWNFPFHNFFCPVIPALFAGNAVVVKVSELATWSSLRYVEIFAEVLRRRGHSPDLVQIVTGYGETGSALVTSGVEKIFFTGSPQNGRKVMAAAAETLTPVVLELGGKDPMIICDDADLEQAVSTATFGVFNACGQMCVGAERLYVFAGIYDAFVREVVARAQALRQGPPLQGEVDVGAMTMPSPRGRGCCAAASRGPTCLATTIRRRCWSTSTTACGSPVRSSSARSW